MKLVKLKYLKTNPAAFSPLHATGEAACFDLSACLLPGSEIFGYTRFNEKIWNETTVGTDSSISIFPRDRALIPTGLVFVIPEGYSLRIHPRSGLSLKTGLTLSNCEGVIDSDYTQETFISVLNQSDVVCKIKHGDRIAQAELVKTTGFEFEETFEKPTQKQNRVGGFGSTGLGATKGRK